LTFDNFKDALPKATYCSYSWHTKRLVQRWVLLVQSASVAPILYELLLKSGKGLEFLSCLSECYNLNYSFWLNVIHYKFWLSWYMSY